VKPWIVLLTLVAGLPVSTPSYAEPEAFRDWALRCPDGGACLLEQRVFLEDGGDTPLLQVSFQQPSGSSGLVALLRVPLGVALQQGLQLRIDQGAEQTFAFHHCRTEGCIALVPVGAALRRSLERGKEARVMFTTIGGQTLGVPLSLLGITRGLAALAASATPGRSNGQAPEGPDSPAGESP
jgi:invasion protein IalB